MRYISLKSIAGCLLVVVLVFVACIAASAQSKQDTTVKQPVTTLQDAEVAQIAQKLYGSMQLISAQHVTNKEVAGTSYTILDNLEQIIAIINREYEKVHPKTNNK